MDFFDFLTNTLKQGLISKEIYEQFRQLHSAYIQTLTEVKVDFSKNVHLFNTYLELVIKQLQTPYTFEPFHKKITHPFDHYRFGLELFAPMVDEKNSVLLHPENLDKMQKQLEAKENVVLFANHQTEVDPQMICIRLQKTHPKLAAEIIFVAGDRVVSDPMAVPLSLGCNLLCIYSKRYIDTPPEKKEFKLTHNQRTMKRMSELLRDGGKLIYVAPSGGRDRKDDQGRIALSAFDPASIEMFRLMAKQANRSTHFYPLALKTYNILPPPKTIRIELGEERIVSREPAHFAFGDEIDMENFPGSTETTDRHAKRMARGEYIFNLVKHHYSLLP